MVGDPLKGLQSSGDLVETVADQVGKYLERVFGGSSNTWVTGQANAVVQPVKNLGQQLQFPNTAYDPNGTVKSKISAVNEVFNKIKGKYEVVKTILDAGKKAFLDALKMPNYTRMNYEVSTKIQWNSDTSDAKTCAKIFLGCVPLYYQALTYIYWGCHENGSGWRNLTLGGGDLKSYFDSQGLLPIFVDRNKRGSHIVDSALGKFSELQQGMAEASSSLSTTNSPYVKFTKELELQVKNNIGQPTKLSSKCPLSALFHGASCYFRYQQITNAKHAVRAPKTIREMLYFLAAFQFSSAYDDTNEHIGTVLDKELSVADSSDSKPDNKLSADQLKEYLRASCAFSSSVLGLIQGPSASQTDTDPWLYELFCNSAFQFKYPSGDSLFSMISNYAYALQFQLIFLYSMCGNIGLKCGWQECTYGKEMNPNGSGNPFLTSHICPGLKCKSGGCDHKKGTGGTNCNHNNYSQSEGRGKSASTPSPLQAFITGALPSFGLSSSSTPNHMSDHPQGALCHTPMGFQANHLRSIGNGAVVYLVLKPICGNFSSPLRQLCEKLGCLTKRTPRSLGDLFGFTWHLKGQVSKSFETITDAEWLKVLIQHTPFSNNLIKDHGDKLKSFVGTDHQAHHSSATDLKALHSSGCNKPNQKCGPYLAPLTLSNGATFGKPPAYASTYLSWMVYLTDDLQSGFQELLAEFGNSDCTKSGCRSKVGGQEACKSKHQPGTHGIDTNCTCDSVVHCGGVLPLLYRHGFTFSDMGALFGESTSDTKRTCAQFQSQLQSVINGEPLTKLLDSIDDFLFLFRYYFLSNLSASWTIYIGLILYTFFFMLDTLHLRSHLKLTASHMVPPLNLLTQGTPLPITKLTYITQ
ncbi:variant erythrocyte surface antigen-1 family protein [Babesia caballi]|uniref:Variant erythrocyte surface antigen-1 family protein n=1 Tax=Babesia caballi TaxID=5871 RepID=A0AAV4LTA6_BABCB|nr:variant erythrocyte surface antigen-1 family protein [Babesia caballi]